MTGAYAGTAGFKRLRVETGDAGFWMGRNFGFSYAFTVPSGGRVTLRASIEGNTLLYASRIQVDAGALWYRVFGFPNTSRETEAFTTDLSGHIHPLNLMDFTPAYDRRTTMRTGGDFDDSGLNAFPEHRIRTAENTNFRDTAGDQPGTLRGFGPGHAYIVLETLTANVCTGVIEYRFEERDWGY